MLVFGCEEPGFKDPKDPSVIWDCDTDPKGTAPTADMPTGGSCATHKKSNQLYQVTRGQPKQRLPPDAGFKVGGDTGLHYLVLRVHQEDLQEWMKQRNETSVTTTKAGFTLTIAKARPGLRRLSLLVLGAHGLLPPHAVTNAEMAYRLRHEPHELTLHPISMQVHTHKLGVVVSTWRVTADGVWSLIGRRNPQDAEIFLPVADPDMIIRSGDVVAARCTFNNTLDHTVSLR